MEENEEEYRAIIDEAIQNIEPYDYPKPAQQSKKDQAYNLNIAKVMGLLSACVVTPNGEGSSEVRFLIEDKNNRVELENYAMNLTRTNFQSLIVVNTEGIKNKKK